jgi:hypothetical protein
MTGTYSGALLGESLRPGAVLDGIPLTVMKIYRAALGNAEAGQPELWTVIEFEVPVGRARELAESLSRLLLTDGGWYCDFRSADEVFIVFSGRIFRYPRGDRAGPGGGIRPVCRRTCSPARPARLTSETCGRQNPPLRPQLAAGHRPAKRPAALGCA